MKVNASSIAKTIAESSVDVLASRDLAAWQGWPVRFTSAWTPGSSA